MYINSRMTREIGQYVRGLRDQGLTTRYVAQHRQLLSMFQAHCMGRGIGTVRSVSTQDVLSFLAKFEPKSGSYQAKAWCILRRFLAEYDNPALLKVRTKVRGTARVHVDWLTPDECEAVWRTPMSLTETLLIGAGLLMGLRRVETLRMTHKDAKDALRTGNLRVRGKGGKERALPMQDDFARLLRAYLGAMEAQDENLPILRLSRTHSETLLAAFCTRHGRKFTFHTLRRSFGRNLWLLSVPIETISELLGHSSIDMTRQYLGIDQSDMRQALARYRIASVCTSTEKLAL
jgi:integrase